MLGIEFEDDSGRDQIFNVYWVNIYDNAGKPIVAVRVVNGEAEVYEFDQGGE